MKYNNPVFTFITCLIPIYKVLKICKYFSYSNNRNCILRTKGREKATGNQKHVGKFQGPLEGGGVEFWYFKCIPEIYFSL